MKGIVGTPEDWTAFNTLLGRYVVAAANAELHLWLLLKDLQRVAGQTQTVKPTMWATSVNKLLALPETPFSPQLQTLMKGTARRGKLRNHNIHNAWFSVTGDSCVGRRALMDADGGAFLLSDRATLLNDVVFMEKFSDDLLDLRVQVQGHRPSA